MEQLIDKEERVTKARSLFKDGGYNCCQSVALAFADVFGLDCDTVAVLSSGFGGGMGRMREVCGCVSGMTFIAGAMLPANDTSDKAAKAANYALVQKLAARYREMNGSILCRELLGLVPMGSGSTSRPESPVPSDRTPEYYKKRPCEELVGVAAGILADEINERRVNGNLYRF